MRSAIAAAGRSRAGPANPAAAGRRRRARAATPSTMSSSSGPLSSRGRSGASPVGVASLPAALPGSTTDVRPSSAASSAACPAMRSDSAVVPPTVAWSGTSLSVPATSAGPSGAAAGGASSSMASSSGASSSLVRSSGSLAIDFWSARSEVPAWCSSSDSENRGSVKALAASSSSGCGRGLGRHGSERGVAIAREVGLRLNGDGPAIRPGVASDDEEEPHRQHARSQRLEGATGGRREAPQAAR